MSTKKLLHGSFGLPLAVGLSLVWGAGCGYPEVSPRAYDVAKALYSACNLQKTEKLQVIGELIDESVTDKSLTSREAGWLRGIVKDAEAGHWERAAAECRRIMEDQIGR